MTGRVLLLALASFSYGLISSAGVFTALAAVGLIPRFTGKTHTAKYTMKYENVVCLGAIVGCYFSVFGRYGQLALYFQESLKIPFRVWQPIGISLQLIYGVFSGAFVGCLALAIAEMLDSIPIFSRRTRFRHGVGLAVLGIALGKILGSLYYFYILR